MQPKRPARGCAPAKRPRGGRPEGRAARHGRPTGTVAEREVARAEAARRIFRGVRELDTPEKCRKAAARTAYECAAGDFGRHDADAMRKLIAEARMCGEWERERQRLALRWEKLEKRAASMGLRFTETDDVEPAAPAEVVDGSPQEG